MIDEIGYTQNTSRLDRLIVQNGLSSNLADFLLACRAADLSPATINYYTWFLKRFIGFCEINGASNLGYITANHIRAYLVEQRKFLKPVSVHSHYRALRRFFNWLVREGELKESPMVNIPPPKVPKCIIQPFNQQQINDLLTVCDINTFIGSRNRAIILLLLDTGLRVSEAAGLKLDDVDIENWRIKVMGKGAKERFVRIGKVTQKALIIYARHRRSCGLIGSWLWLSSQGERLLPDGIRQMMSVLGIRAGITGIRCSPHTLRHTFATQSLINGAESWEVQSLLGHEKDFMTKHYQETIRNRLAAEDHARFSPADRMKLD